MLGLDPKAARVTWTAAITLVALAGIYAIRGTLVVFAVALLFAYLLHPLVGQIGRRFSGKNRGPALALTYLFVMSVVVSLAIAIGTRVVTEARHFLANPPDVWGFLDGIRLAHPALAPAIVAVRGDIQSQLGELASLGPRFGLGVLAVSANLVYLIVIPILSFFILKDGARLREGFLSLFEVGASRTNAARTVARVHLMLLQYMRALLILCCTALATFGVVLTVMGVRYALLLAAVAFFCEFVPLVGPITEIVVILAVSALTGYSHLLLLGAFLGVFRLVQDYAIWPRLMSEGISLHPLWVIFGVFAGGQIGGVAGVFFGVPVLALGRIVLLPLQEDKGASPGDAGWV